MVHARKIGRINEFKYKELKEKEGYKVELTKTSVYHDMDFWGYFDAICIKKDGGLLVQCKTNTFSTKEMERLKGFLPWKPDNFKIILAIWYDKGKSKTYQGWREVEVL